MNEVRGNKSDHSSMDLEDLLKVIKNKYFIEIFVLILVLIYLIVVGLNFYRQHKYAFEVNKHFYTINEINALTSLPRSFDSKTDYKKKAYVYYRTIAAADKLHLYYSQSDYDSVLATENKKYKQTDNSNNSWVNLETRYITIKNYLDTGTFIAKQKQGFFCEFYFVNNGLKEGNSQFMQDAVLRFKNFVKFDSSNMYSMDEYYSKYPNDQKFLKIGTCRNFGYYTNWIQEVQIPDVVNKIKSVKTTGMSNIFVGNNEGKPSYNYFFNLSSAIDYPAFNNKDFQDTYNKMSHSYYEK